MIWLVILLICCGCTVFESVDTGHSRDVELINVRFVVDDVVGKSSISPDECKWEYLNIYAYSQGQIAAYRCFDYGDNPVLELIRDREYDLYVLAGTKKVEPDPMLDDFLRNCEVRASSFDELQGGFSFAWKSEGHKVESSSINVILERLVAKVVLSIDDSALKGLRVTSVRLCQSPLKVCPFMEGGSRVLCDEDVGDGDFATEADIYTLNKGGSVQFYVLENCQGLLLPQNTDPWTKTPDSIPESADLCTYLELMCEFESESFYQGEVLYRIYLGRDNVSDFNVRRNEVLNLTLTLTDSSLKKLSWKVTPDVGIADGFVEGSVVSEGQSAEDLYVGERFRYRLEMKDELSEYLSGNVQGCKVALFDFSSPESASDAVEFGSLQCSSEGDNVYVLDALCREPASGYLVFIGSDGTMLGTLEEYFCVKPPNVKYSFGGSLMINGSARVCDVYFCDDSGVNLNSETYELSLFDFDLTAMSDYDIEDKLERKVLRSESAENEPVISCQLKVVNDGSDSSCNYALAQSCISEGSVNLNFSEKNLGLSADIPLSLDYYPVKLTLVDNGWAGYAQTEWGIFVENTSRLSVYINFLKADVSGAACTDEERNEIVDYVETEIYVSRKQVMNSSYYSGTNPVYVSSTMLTTSSDDVALSFERLSSYGMQAAMLYDYRLHQYMTNHIVVEIKGAGPDCKVSVLDEFSDGSEEFETKYGINGLNNKGLWVYFPNGVVVDPYPSFHESYPGVTANGIFEVFQHGTNSFKFNYDDTEEKFLMLMKESYIDEILMDVKVKVTVKGYVRTYPNGIFGAAVDNTCYATCEEEVKNLCIHQGESLEFDGGALREALDKIYATTYKDYKNTTVSYQHSAHPVAVNVNLFLKLSESENVELFPMVCNFPSKFDFYHAQDGVTYSVPLTCSLSLQELNLVDM